MVLKDQSFERVPVPWRSAATRVANRMMYVMPMEVDTDWMTSMASEAWDNW